MMRYRAQRLSLRFSSTLMDNYWSRGYIHDRPRLGGLQIGQQVVKAPSDQGRAGHILLVTKTHRLGCATFDAPDLNAAKGSVSLGCQKMRTMVGTSPPMIRSRMQATELLLRHPADPTVSRTNFERPRRSTEPRHSTPARQLHRMPQRRPEWAPKAQVVVRLHETVPSRSSPRRPEPDAPATPANPPPSPSLPCRTPLKAKRTGIAAQMGANIQNPIFPLKSIG